MSSENVNDFQYSFFGMLISFLVIMIAAPLASGFYASLIVSTFLGFMLISSVFALTSNRATLFSGTLLGISAVIFLGMDFLISSWWIHLFSMINAALLIGLTTVVHFRRVFFTHRYTSNTVFGAVCVFLLLGFFFSLIYETIEHIRPDSFKGFYTSTIDSTPVLGLGEMFQNFLYFSFVTQTTLGYGDIVPQTYLTQNLAITQAIMGQFYIAVLVAGIIGKMLRNKD